MKRIFSFLLLLFAGIGVSLFLNSANISEEKQDMEAIVKTLKSHKIENFLFTNSQGNQFLVIPKFGGRILAVSVGGENLFWTHPDVLKGQGGQRSWISPEGGAKGFIFRPDWKGNRDFSMLDPGQYKVTLHKENEHLALSNTFKTTSNDGRENYDLTLTREFRPSEDPLKVLPAFKDLDYQYLGIDFVHKLRNNSKKFLDRILGLWCLIQIPPQGTMVVPVHRVEKAAWRGNYFEPISEEYVKANPDSFSFFIHGSQRYKVGLRPESAQGVICYFSKAKNGDHSLVFMEFPVMPEARYVDRPKEEQKTNGDAIQIYSHLEKGPLAFGELECHSWGLDLETGEEAAFPIKIGIYKGTLEVMKEIGKTLICPQFDKAHFFK
jgi:hypothetical protein